VSIRKHLHKNLLTHRGQKSAPEMAIVMNYITVLISLLLQECRPAQELVRVSIRKHLHKNLLTHRGQKSVQEMAIVIVLILLL
jgi:hypothetical protein